MTEFLSFLRFQVRLFGTIFCLAGVVFFFAFHWQIVPKFAKFGILFFILLLTTAYTIGSKTESQKKELATFISSVLVGQILFVFGQTYQTGANSFYLFFAWFLFSGPFVLTSFSFISVFPWVHLGSICLTLYFSEIFFADLDSYLFIPLIVWNITLFFLFRFFSFAYFKKTFPFAEGYFFLLATVLIVSELISGIFHDWNHIIYKITTTFGILTLSSFFLLFYFKFRYFIGMIILCFASLILLFSYTVYWFDLNSISAYVLVCFLFILITFGILRWLKKLKEEWK